MIDSLNIHIQCKEEEDWEKRKDEKLTKNTSATNASGTSCSGSSGTEVSLPIKWKSVIDDSLSKSDDEDILRTSY